MCSNYDHMSNICNNEVQQNKKINDNAAGLNNVFQLLFFFSGEKYAFIIYYINIHNIDDCG